MKCGFSFVTNVKQLLNWQCTNIQLSQKHYRGILKSLIINIDSEFRNLLYSPETKTTWPSYYASIKQIWPRKTLKICLTLTLFLRRLLSLTVIFDCFLHVIFPSIVLMDWGYKLYCRFETWKLTSFSCNFRGVGTFRMGERGWGGGRKNIGHHYYFILRESDFLWEI